jgi:hypothetical protein
MAERERRQSWRRTRRQLHKSLNRDGRKWVRQVWDAAARTAGDLEALSPLTTLLGNRLVEDYSAREQLVSEDLQEALRVAVISGYTCRLVIVDSTGQHKLRRAAFGLGAKADAEQLARDDNAANKVLDPVKTIATAQFDSIMALPPEIWSAYIALATQKLQHQFTGRATKLDWRALGRERVETMTRYGYVLCCLDEAIGAEPQFREPGAEPAAEPEPATEPATAE